MSLHVEKLQQDNFSLSYHLSSQKNLKAKDLQTLNQPSTALEHHNKHAQQKKPTTLTDEEEEYIGDEFQTVRSSDKGEKQE